MSDEQKDHLTDPNDYILDLSSMRKPEEASEGGAPASAKPAPRQGPVGPDGKPSFISVYFKCCNAYARFYRSHDGLAYSGRCPKCMRQGSVAASGVNAESRMYVAG